MDFDAQNQDSGAAVKPGDLQGTAASTVRDVLERAESATAGAAGRVEQVVARIPQAAQAPLYHAVHAAADAAASMRERAAGAEGALGGSITQYVRTNPRRSVAFAFATGWLIARIVF
jgi:hypothetical protein